MNKSESKLLSNKTALSYIGIFFVVFLWGIDPVFTKYILQEYSATAYSLTSKFIAAVILFFLCVKKLNKLNLKYLKVAIPTGFFMSTASLIQKIGLQYTTPAIYAFLENTSVIFVPILLLVFYRRKPTVMKIIGCLICFASIYIISGGIESGFTSFGIGEILCATAGLLYSINIACTGVHAEEFDSSLYVFVQHIVSCVVYVISAIILNNVFHDDGNGNFVPLEKFKFAWDIKYLIFIGLLSFVAGVLCWIIRTAAMRKIDPTVVTVIMPFSAVVTGIGSVISGYDSLSLALILGGTLGMIAILISSIDDIKTSKKQEKLANEIPSENTNEQINENQ